jgi:hypothetical protein
MRTAALFLIGAALAWALGGCRHGAPISAGTPAANAAPPTDREITVPVIRPGHAKYEPDHACFIGAFIHRDSVVNDSAQQWERLVGKGHASYLHYVGYGRPFPMGWVQGLRRIGAAPNIAFEPNSGLDKVKDDEYLRGWARQAAVSGGPVFLRFASEFNGEWVAYNGNPKLYIEKFRLVHRVMRDEAPNVALVWTPYVLPKEFIAPYYPGDDAVDWVGANLYSVHHHNGRIDKPAGWEDPVKMIRWMYDRYSKRKPIQISEYGATHFCQACGKEMPEFGLSKMVPFYQSLPRKYPRIKMIYYFSVDTAAQRIAENNYGLTSSPPMMQAYQQLISLPYFLPRIAEGEYWTRRRVPLPGDWRTASFPNGKLPGS